MSTALTTLPEKSDIPALFSKDGAIMAIVAKIEKETLAVVPDLKTAKGRKAQLSLAAKVSRSKTLIDDVGKDLNEDRNRLNKEVNAVRIEVKDALDELRDKLKKPVLDWENDEADRVRKHQVQLAVFDDDTLTAMSTSDEIQSQLAQIEATKIDDTWEEFEDEAVEAKEHALKKYKADFDVAKSREDNEAELEKLRAESSKRDEEDRQRKAKEQADQEERDRKAKQEEIESRQAKESLEREAKAKLGAEEKAARDKKDAEERHQRELQEAKDREEQAAQRERDRLADDRRAEESKAAQRRQNAEIRSKAVDTIMAAMNNVEPRTVKGMVEAMIDGKIPMVVVNL